MGCQVLIATAYYTTWRVHYSRYT